MTSLTMYLFQMKVSSHKIIFFVFTYFFLMGIMKFLWKQGLK